MQGWDLAQALLWVPEHCFHNIVFIDFVCPDRYDENETLSVQCLTPSFSFPDTSRA